MGDKLIQPGIPSLNANAVADGAKEAVAKAKVAEGGCDLTAKPVAHSLGQSIVANATARPAHEAEHAQLAFPGSGGGRSQTVQGQPTGIKRLGDDDAKYLQGGGVAKQEGQGQSQDVQGTPTGKKGFEPGQTELHGQGLSQDIKATPTGKQGFEPGQLPGVTPLGKDNHGPIDAPRGDGYAKVSQEQFEKQLNEMSGHFDGDGVKTGGQPIHGPIDAPRGDGYAKFSEDQFAKQAKELGKSIDVQGQPTGKKGFEPGMDSLHSQSIQGTPTGKPGIEGGGMIDPGFNGPTPHQDVQGQPTGKQGFEPGEIIDPGFNGPQSHHQDVQGHPTGKGGISPIHRLTPEQLQEVAKPIQKGHRLPQ